MRIVTLNIWQEQGPWEQRLDVIARQLAALEPDVVCLQEVRQKGDQIPNQAQRIGEDLGMSAVYETAQPWGGGDEGLAVLSRWPARSRVSCELPFVEGRSRRICLGAEVRPGAWVFTTHLAFRLGDGALRERQVRAATRFVDEARGAGIAVLAGDFNASPGADEIRYMVGATSLGGERVFFQDAWAACHPDQPGPTWCRANPYTGQLGWYPRDRRLDYIFVTPCTPRGRGRVLRCEIVCNIPAANGVWCSDHYGVLADVAA